MGMTTNTRNGKNGRVTPPKPRVVAAVHDDPAAITATEPVGTLALLKVLVQPTFVLIAPDGSCREVPHDTVAINGADWASWAPTSFNADVLESLRQVIVVQPRGPQA